MITPRQNISIRLWSDGFCFTVPTVTYPVVVGVGYGDDFYTAITNNAILGPLLTNARNEGSVVSATFIDAPFAVVPLPFASSDEYGVKDDFSQRMSYDVPLERSNAVLRFSVEEKLAALFEGFNVTHALVELSHQEYERVARFEAKCLSVIIRKNGELIYANIFKCAEASDAAYHLLNVYKQLGLDVEQPLNISAPRELTDLLEAYIKLNILNDLCG